MIFHVCDVPLYGGLINELMKEDAKDVYSDNTIDINLETFTKDFDEVDWNPVEVDDSDEKAKELYGF